MTLNGIDFNWESPFLLSIVLIKKVQVPQKKRLSSNYYFHISAFDHDKARHSICPRSLVESGFLSEGGCHLTA